MPIYDFECPECHTRLSDQLVSSGTVMSCPTCGEPMEKDACAPAIFNTIVPTYPGAMAHKAGHIHKFKNRPAEKTQIGYGGGVSSDHPTGSMKNKD